MAFLSKMFSKPDYFADVKKETERLKANKDSQALILLMQNVQKKNKSENEDYAVFSQKRTNCVYQAALALADLGDPKAVEPVIECLKEGIFGSDKYYTYWWSPGPQIVAKFGSIAVEPLIYRLLKDEFGGRMGDFAASALGLIGDNRAIDPLLKQCEPDLRQEYFRTTMVWALGNIGGGKEVVEMLVSALINNQKSESEAEALFAFSSGKFGKLAEEILLPLLNDQALHFVKKHKVAQALGVMGNPESINTLLGEDANIDLVFLGRFKDQRVTERLTRHLDDSHSGDPLEAKWFFAALGLAEQGDKKSVKPLVECLGISELGNVYYHPWYRQSIHSMALQALKDLGNTAIEELTNLSKDLDARIKTQAEKILQYLQSS